MLTSTALPPLNPVTGYANVRVLVPNPFLAHDWGIFGFDDGISRSPLGTIFGVGEGEGLEEGEGDGLGTGEGEGDGLGDGDGEGLGLGLGVGEALGDGLGEGEAAVSLSDALSIVNDPFCSIK